MPATQLHVPLAREPLDAGLQAGQVRPQVFEHGSSVSQYRVCREQDFLGGEEERNGVGCVAGRVKDFEGRCRVEEEGLAGAEGVEKG